MPERRVPTWLNRPLNPFPRVLAPTAMARATNTTSKAYSVAVAPLFVAVKMFDQAAESGRKGDQKDVHDHLNPLQRFEPRMTQKHLP
jgi:hypothetical protein